MVDKIRVSEGRKLEITLNHLPAFEAKFFASNETSTAQMIFFPGYTDSTLFTYSPRYFHLMFFRILPQTIFRAISFTGPIQGTRYLKGSPTLSTNKVNCRVGTFTCIGTKEMFSIKYPLVKQISQATIRHNQKGQLFRVKE